MATETLKPDLGAARSFRELTRRRELRTDPDRQRRVHAAADAAPVASAPPPTPQVRLIGFSDRDFVDKLINDLRNLGFDGRAAYLDLAPAIEKDRVVIDICEATHPLFGGSTGWQLVRHFLHQGARVVVVADPGCVVPEDIAGRAGVHKGNPSSHELASAMLSET